MLKGVRIRVSDRVRVRVRVGVRVKVRVRGKITVWVTVRLIGMGPDIFPRNRSDTRRPEDKGKAG